MPGSLVLHLRQAGAPGSPWRSAGSNGFPDDQLESFCRRITPEWSVDSQGIHLDISGCGRLLGWGLDGPAKVCALARKELGPLSGGAASSPLAARLASRYALSRGPGMVCHVPGQGVARFLSHFPVTVLHGYPQIVGRLGQLGVRTLGDLQILPRELLQAVFGDQAAPVLVQAFGRDTLKRGTSPGASPEFQLVAGVQLSRPMASPDGLAALGEGLALRALARFPAGMGPGCSLRLRARLSGPRWRLARLPAEGSSTLLQWRFLVRTLLAKLELHRGGLIRLELQAGSTAGGSVVQELLFQDDISERQLAQALGRINEIRGGNIFPASEKLLESWGARWFSAEPQEARTGVDAWPGGQ